jgi:formamidopyrimidine-DNA glycosylase
MPELPEVETSLRGISPHIKNQIVTQVIIRQPQLRWPIPSNLPELLGQQELKSLSRRAKYLLLHFDTGTLLIHLVENAQKAFFQAIKLHRIDADQ